MIIQTAKQQVVFLFSQNSRKEVQITKKANLRRSSLHRKGDVKRAVYYVLNKSFGEI